MSIWGAQAHENDDASDWLFELEEDPSITQINEALDGVLEGGAGGYLEVTECAEAVAASTVVANMCSLDFAKDMLADETTAELVKLAKELSPKATKRFIQRALLSLAPVQDPKRSELHELMAQAPELGAAWSKRMSELERGLQAIYQRLEQP